jgi:hypothetical protein
MGSKLRQLRRQRRGNTMKTINYVPDILMTNTRREPYMVRVRENEDGPVTLEQAKLSQRELFLQRLEDQALVQGKSPLKAAKFANAIFDAIEAQSKELVSKRGFWVFEDEHADAIAKVVRNGPSPTERNPQGGYSAEFLHNFVPMLDAVEPDNVKTYKEPAPDKASVNGVEAKALPEAAQA